jgi:hypothetical protein
MDAQTCPTCGCLVGDEEIHRNWHASAAPGGPATGDAAARPDSQEADDPAPYSA